MSGRTAVFGRQDLVRAVALGLDGCEQVALDRHGGADGTKGGSDALGIGLRDPLADRPGRLREQLLGEVLRQSGDAGEFPLDGCQVVVTGCAALQNNAIEHESARIAELG